jgi:NDP-sugar pyrophosphorylase family protein
MLTRLWPEPYHPSAMSANPIAASSLLDLSRSLAASILDPEGYPWLAIPRIAAFVAALVAEPPPGYRRVTDLVIAAEGAQISPRAELLGPAVIGRGSEIRTGAFIRENVLVGELCVVGNSTELKNCVLFDLAQAPHFNYVGDSILGLGAHMGAGSILSNLKSDKSEVFVSGPGGERIATGLVKFGAILGDRAELGSNCVCNPGTIVGREGTAYPLCSIRGYLPERSILKSDGRVVAKRP